MEITDGGQYCFNCFSEMRIIHTDAAFTDVKELVESVAVKLQAYSCDSIRTMRHCSIHALRCVCAKLHVCADWYPKENSCLQKFTKEMTYVGAGMKTRTW